MGRVGADFILHPLIHTLLDFNLAQFVVHSQWHKVGGFIARGAKCGKDFSAIERGGDFDLPLDNIR